MTPEAAPRTPRTTAGRLFVAYAFKAGMNWTWLQEEVLAIEAEAAAGTALPSGSPEPDGLDVERLARAFAVSNVGLIDIWTLEPMLLRSGLPKVAAEYARLAGEDSKP